MKGGRIMRVPLVAKSALIGLVVLSITLFTGASVEADTIETVTGTAIVTGGNATSTGDFVYTTTGILGSGTYHTDFVLDLGLPIFHFQGTGVFTRSDGATLSGTASGTVEFISGSSHVTSSFIPTSGTGGLAGVTGEILSVGNPSPPPSIGAVFTLSGTLTIPSAVPTDKAQCKHGGWHDLVDDQAEPFPNQGQCVSLVEHLTKSRNSNA